jgi:hypothetical protein
MSFTSKRLSLQLFLLAAIMSMVSVLPIPVSAVSSVQSLPIGSYWSGSGTIQRTLQGTGSYAGTWSEDSTYTRKFTIVNQEGNTVTTSEEYSGSWSATATGAWVKRNGGELKQGTIAPVRVDYTINLTTMNFTAVSSKTGLAAARLVGHLTWLFIDPQSVSPGGTVSLYRAGSTVPFAVAASQIIRINGAGVDTWLLTYTGPANGTWHVGNNYAMGNETDTFLYDKAYCIAVGWANTGNFSYAEEGGSLTETISYYFRVSDSNVAFSKLRGTDTSHPVQITRTAQDALVIVAVMLAALVLVLVYSGQLWRIVPQRGTITASEGIKLRQLTY